MGGEPIDLAFRAGHTNVCQILAKPAEKERMVGDVPEAVLNEIMRIEYSEEPTFVSLNKNNAPAVFGEWLGRLWKDVRPASQSELSKGSEKQAGHFQDKQTKEAGRRVDIEIKRTKEGYEWAISSSHGPIAGYGESGKLVKRYGCWLRTDVKGWES